MHKHLFKKIKADEKVETIDYLYNQSYEELKPSKTKIITVTGINEATYYAIKGHTPSKAEIKREECKRLILNKYYEFKEIYGAPKIYEEICKEKGRDYMSLRTVSVYMRSLGLKAITEPKFKGKSNKEQQLPFNIPMINYIKEDRPDKLHTHILTDITYIYTTQEGWKYLLTFMDMKSRKILEWDINDEMSSIWVCEVARKLIKNYPNIEYIHSDRGSQYTSKEYLTLLLKAGIAPSFSAKGYPYHNAWIESFHAQLKKEYIYRRVLLNLEEAKMACFNYIEGFYNTIRSQKVLGYISPNEYELLQA